ncbi:Peptidase S8/S53 domain [Arabidopsis thaliana x Arabidopsis arenosa]|uniref:Peptidase S8/S53 domain n=1 Tax=Arabidopsis thaliana x Arabidopsis arenosa TaxID=1240361 RepID=A0A8T1YW90_9BRAS|nr:Peptidase S8/S53 domain [Arabidopsis thaliana x Arabidopsis arenosa]
MMSSQVSWWVFWVISAVCILNVEFNIVEGGAYEETKVHIVYLGEKEHNDPELVTASHLRMLESLLGSKKDASESIVHSYRHGFSGFAAHLTDSQAKKISEHPDVVQVTPNSFYELQTTRTFDYLGLSRSTPKGLLYKAKMGKDIIIGVLDSGVWPESQSFNDKGLGPIPKRWKGMCVDGEDFDSKKHCNKKLIGARYYMDSLFRRNKTDSRIPDTEYMSAREGLPHGTHVASTAGGSFVSNVSDNGFGVGTIRGGAPSARIAVYKVCWQRVDGTCASADIIKAMDDAIADGVDLITISIGRPNPVLTEVDMYNQISYGAFHAVASGIPVLSAGGNFGPGAYTVQNIAPWIITVAATTLDRWYPTPLTLGNNVTLMARTSYKGNKIQGDLMYVYSADEMTSAAKGKVVLSFTTGSEESQSDYVTKLLEVEAKAVIIAGKRDDVIKVSEGLPVIMVDYEHGSTIWKYISITRSPTIKISSAIALNGPLVATKVADFSGRGPNSISPYVLKPDVAAPGVAIVAASTPEDMSTNEGVAAQSGTSMATPVVAGLVALLRAVHPDWSPAALKSALVTTASTTDPYGEPIFSEGMTRKLADPFDFGGGLVNPNKAADPGLVYDIGAEDYRLFLCASDYDERQITKISKTNKPYRCPNPRPSMLDLNLPSITIPFLKEDVTLTRTVTNVGPVDSVYKLVVKPPLGVKISVTPKTLLFNSNVKKLSFKVIVSTTHKSNSIYYFGSLTWTDGYHKVTIPLSVRTQMLMYFDQ